MSEAKKNGLPANFVDVSSLSLFPPDFPITMRVLGHPFTCTHMCPQCPHLRKIVYNFSTIAYNGVTFSLFFGPFSSIFVDIRLRLGPSPPVLTVLTCPHPPPFSSVYCFAPSYHIFIFLPSPSPLHAPIGLVLPCSPTFPTIHYLSYTLPFLNFRQYPSTQLWAPQSLKTSPRTPPQPPQDASSLSSKHKILSPTSQFNIRPLNLILSKCGTQCPTCGESINSPHSTPALFLSPPP